jgi:hypothetical protein
MDQSIHCGCRLAEPSDFIGVGHIDAPQRKLSCQHDKEVLIK